MTPTNYVKIRFNLKGEPVAGETLWAEQLSENRHRLLNIPFHAIGYAYGDVVRTKENGGWQEVVGLEEDSGNGTVRIYFRDENHPTVEVVLTELGEMGCEIERASAKFAAVSIPLTMATPFSHIAHYLNTVADDGLLNWEIGKRRNLQLLDSTNQT
jgi:hypothetical protein